MLWPIGWSAKATHIALREMCHPCGQCDLATVWQTHRGIRRDTNASAGVLLLIENYPQKPVQRDIRHVDTRTVDRDEILHFDWRRNLWGHYRRGGSRLFDAVEIERIPDGQPKEGRGLRIR